MKEKLRTLFQQKFNPIEYRKVVLENLLHAQQLLSQPQFLEETNDGDRIYGLGYLIDADGKQIGLYYTVVVNSDVRRKRVGFRQMMKKYTDFGVDAAIAVFSDKEHWRLSYMSDLKGGETSAKRFSYILGDLNGQYNTPVNRLAKLGTQVSRLRLKDIFEAFSVETLSDEFFDLYRDHYADIVEYLTGKRMVKVDSKWVEKVIHAPLQSVYEQLKGIENADKIVRDYVKKMMGRIVFLHFLQKKEWLNDDTKFMQHTFSRNKDCQDDFLEKILEPLFFGFLNTRKEDRAKLFDKHPNWDKQLLTVWENIPYLNGGLFEQDEVDNLNIRLPRSMFDDLFTFLAEYNFTVDENDPDDAEVGVDPEMLGKIFESLLEDNKAKGAFYTPKEIVCYMCKESLIAYLSSRISESPCPTANGENNLQDSQDFASETSRSIRKFVETHEMQPELEPYRDTLDTALREVKICDPAIGSGAFPMGLLNELWRCREAIEETSSRVELKKEIIENNIYGVDIEKGAIDIARLRFWLSIVVDAEEPEPLPNFDYKFMHGNSLIESFEGFDLSHISDRLRGGQPTSRQLVIGLDSHLSRQNLQRFLREYFSVTDHQQKANMRHSINEEVKTLIRESIGGTPTSLAKLEKMDCSANQDFFLWHTWFKDIFDNGGFDIVIGNPPYFQMKKGLVDKSKYPYSEGKDKGKQNIYKLFVEHAYNILNNGGICALITQSSLMCDSSSQYTRELLIKKTSLFQVIEFPKVAPHPEGQLFKGALVATCIVLFSKGLPCNNHTFFLSANNDLTTINRFDFAVIPQQTPILFYPQGYYFPLIRHDDFSIIEKMNEGTTFLKKMIQSSSQGDFNLTNESFCFSTRLTDVKMYRGCHVHRFYIDKVVDEYIQGGYKNDIVLKNTLNTYFVCQQISGMTDRRRFNVSLTRKERCLFGNSVNKLALTQNCNSKYILAIINSRIIDWYFRKTSTNNHVNIYELEQLPIPKANREQENSITSLIDRIVTIKQNNPNYDISPLEKEIDKLVYQLYNLTPEEIAIIEQQ